MAGRRLDVPGWRQDIGDRISDSRMAKEMSQAQLAELLEEYRRNHFPEFKPFTRNDVENIENGGKYIRAEHILALSSVLSISCDELLTGYPPEDRSIEEDFGLSPKAIKALRNKDFSAETINFFIDNNLYSVLNELRRFIELDADDFPDLGSVLELKELGIGKETLIDARRFLFVERLKKWRRDYRALNKTRLNRESQKKREGGGDNGEKSKW